MGESTRPTTAVFIRHSFQARFSRKRPHLAVGVGIILQVASSVKHGICWRVGGGDFLECCALRVLADCRHASLSCFQAFCLSDHGVLRFHGGRGCVLFFFFLLAVVYSLVSCVCVLRTSATPAVLEKMRLGCMSVHSYKNCLVGMDVVLRVWIWSTRFCPRSGDNKCFSCWVGGRAWKNKLSEKEKRGNEGMHEGKVSG